VLTVLRNAHAGVSNLEMDEGHDRFHAGYCVIGQSIPVCTLSNLRRTQNCVWRGLEKS
jgi:hypothetical protein